MSQTMTDTSDMPRVHQVFRAGFAAAPALVAGAGGAERHEMVISFYANLLEFLHCHHHGEDELIWPRVKERGPERAEVVERLEAQHQAVSALLDQALSSLSAWQAAPSDCLSSPLTSARRNTAPCPATPCGPSPATRSGSSSASSERT